MKIGFLSDVHFEFHKQTPNWLPPLPQECDVLVLAGDISVGDHTLEAVKRISAQVPTTHIVWIAGNHDFYDSNIEHQIEIYRVQCAELPFIHFLENESVIIDGVTFLGATLWTDFSVLGPQSQQEGSILAQRCIADFHHIHISDNELWHPQSAARKFADSQHWLQTKLSSIKDQPCVVVTHFPPCRDAKHGGFEESLLSTYFQANCEDLIKTYQPNLWIYGHNHYSRSFKIGKTHICSNQLGYPDENVPGIQFPVVELQL